MNRFILSIALFAAGLTVNQAQEIKEVLFLGNSYTAVNNLPQALHDVAAGKGDSVSFDSYTPGGYTFQSHSSDASALAKIHSRRWDYVVLQEQSQLPSFPPSQVSTDVFPYAHKLDSIIRANDSCTETVFYMTWGRKNGDASNCASWPPVCTYEGMQEQLRKNYLQMSVDNHAIVAPAGMAWYKARLQAPAFDLWSSDESHPSVYGTYLTACVFYAMLFNESPEGCTFISSISATDAQFLQHIAAVTVFDSLDQWAGHGDNAYARFNAAPNGYSVQFSDSSINANDWVWDFGDGQSSVQENPQHTYASAGVYVVSLSVTNHCFTDTISDTLAIDPLTTADDSGFTNSFSIWPNPAADHFTVTGPEKTGSIDVFLYDLQGRILATRRLENGNHEVILSNLTPGMYYVRIVSDTGSCAIPLLHKN